MTYIWTTPEDVKKVVEALRAERGELSLAMLYNEGGPSLTGWNLIISAPWADQLGRAEAIGVVRRALSEGLNPENWNAISRITILPTGDDFVREITSFYTVTSPGDVRRVDNTSVAGIPIGAAFIFYSQSKLTAVR